MESIIGWIKPIIYFAIFITVMLQLLHKDTYTKYIRFFAGLLLLVLVITPLFRFFEESELAVPTISEVYEEALQEENWDETYYEEQSTLFFETWLESHLEGIE